jgi:hypothetical protein
VLVDVKWSVEHQLMGKVFIIASKSQELKSIFSDRHRSSSVKPSSAPINTPKHRDRSHTPKSRDSSPRVVRLMSEEIPLENLNSSPSSSRCSSNAPSRSHTPSRLAIDSSGGLSLPKEVVATTAAPLTTPNGSVVQRSEETSFMGEERRRKGAIEIV